MARPRMPFRLTLLALALLTGLLAWGLVGSVAWAQQTSEPPRLVGHAAAINTVLYSPDGSIIATAGADQLIKLWDAQSGKELRSLQGHAGQVLTLAMHPNNRFLVSGASDNTLKLWDLPRPDPLHSFAGHAAAVGDVAVSPDGRSAVSAGDKAIRFWDLETRQPGPVWEDAPAVLTRVAYRGDGNQIASGDAEGRVLLWNVITGQPQSRLGAHVGAVTALIYHPNNQQLLSSGEDGSLKVWQLPVPRPEALGSHESPVTAVAVAPNGQVAVVGSGETLQLFNLTNGQPLRVLEQNPGNVTDLAVRSDNAVLAAAGERGDVRLWSLSDGADLGLLSGHEGPVRGVAMLPGNQRLITAGDDGTLRVWQFPVADVPLAGVAPDALAVASSPDGQTIAVGASDGQIRLFNAATGQALRTLTGHAAPVALLRFRGDGGQLASGDAAGELRLWNPADGQLQATLGAHAGQVRSAAYQSGGQLLVTAGADGSLKRWNMPPAAPLVLAGHSTPVLAVDAHAETSRIITASGDKTVRVFDAAGDGGQPLRTLAGLNGVPTVARQSPDGQLAAVATDQGAIRIWNVESGEPFGGNAEMPAADSAAANPAAPGAESVLPAAVAELVGHDGATLDVSWDAASNHLATAGADGTIRLWRLPTRPRLVGPALPEVTRGAVSPDGKLLAAATLLGERPVIVVRETATGRTVNQLLDHAAPCTALAFAADSLQLATASADNSAIAWDLSDPKFPRRRKVTLPSPATAVALSGEHELLVTGGTDNVIRLWPLRVPAEAAEAAATAEPQTLTGHGGAITQLVVRGDLLFSAAADNTVRIWNLATGAAVRAVNHGAAVGALAVSNDGKLIASGGANGTIKLWNSDNGAAGGELAGRHAALRSLGFTPDGRWLTSTSGENLVVWDVASLRCLQSLAIAPWETVAVGFDAAALTPSASSAPSASPAAASPLDLPARSGQGVLAIGTDGTTRRYELDVVRVLEAGEGAVAGVALLPEATRVAGGGADGTVTIWNVLDGKVERTLQGPQAAVTDLAVSRDGATLAAAGEDQHVYLWSLPAPTAAAPAEPLQPSRSIATAAIVRRVALSADGSRVAAGLDDGTAAVWQASTGAELERFAAHQGQVHALALAADGQSLVTGGADNAARRWTLSTGIIARQEPGGFHDVVFAPDGGTLLAAGEQPRIRVWKVDDQRQLAEAPTLPPGETMPAGWQPAPGRRLALDGEGERLAVLDAQGTVSVWRLSDAGLAGTIAAPPPADSESAPTNSAASAAPETPTVEPPAGQLAFSRNDTRLIVARGELVELFDAASHNRLQRLAQPATVTSLDTIGDTERLVVSRRGTTNNAVLVTPAFLTWLRQPEAKLVGVAATPTANQALTAAADGRVTLWDLEQQQPVRAYAGGSQGITCLGVTPDGARILAGDREGVVRVWPLQPDVQQGSPEQASPQPTPAPPAPEAAASVEEIQLARQFRQPSPVLALAVSANGEQVATAGGDGQLRVWDFASGTLRQFFAEHEGPLLDVAFAPDNQTLLTGGEDLAARRVRLSVLHSVVAHEGPARDLALLAAGAQAVTAGEDGKLVLWNLSNGQPLRTLEGDQPWVAVAVRPDNNQLVAADATQRIHLWNPADATLQTQYKVEADVTRLRYDPAGEKFAAIMRDGGLRFYSPEDGRLMYELQSEQPATALAFAGEGRQVLTGGEDGSVNLWSYASPEAVRTFTGHGGPVFDVAISPDGATIASASADQTARLWNLEAGNQRSQLSGHQGPVYQIAFSPDGALAGSCGADGTIRLWDVLGGRQLKQIAGSEQSIYSLAFHPGGKLLAAAGLDKSVRLLDPTSGSLQREMEGHEDFLYRVRFNAAGTRLLSCGYGGELRIWNAANGQPLFETNLDIVTNDAAFTPDGSRIMAACGDGRVRFVEVPAAAR